MNTSTMKFQASASPRLAMPWGGGHTPQTDPSRQGWTSCLLQDRPREIWAIYQQGGTGCASLSQTRMGGDWKVTIVARSVTTLARAVRSGTVIRGVRITIPDHPGFGLRVIRAIEGVEGQALRAEEVEAVEAVDYAKVVKARAALAAARRRRDASEEAAVDADSKGDFRAALAQAEVEGVDVRARIRLVKDLLRGKSGRPRK